MPRIFLFILLLVATSTDSFARPGDSVDDVADSWVRHEIGRDPLEVDSILDALKDLVVGRQVSAPMGGILGRINEAMAQAEGTYGKPNKRRGLCGSAAVRQASGITSDAQHSRMFRAFGGTFTEAMGAAYGIPSNAARWATKEGAEELEKMIGEALSEQDPEDYVLSKSQEGCTIEMRVIWNKSRQVYKFAIMGDCGCNKVKCWNFDTREISLGRWTVYGQGTITPVISKNGDDIQIHYNIGRITGSSLQVNADCCDSGQFGTTDEYWVNLDPTEHAVTSPPVSTPPPPPPQRPQTGGGTPTSSGTQTSTPAIPAPEPEKPEPQPEPEPKPVQEKPKPIKCPQCDPIKKKISDAQGKQKQAKKDKADATRAHADKKAELARAQAEEKRLERSLSGERGVGAESTDPTTGIRTTSYDNGDGQVEIKRFDRDGNQIGQTEYRKRPSTKDRRNALEAIRRDIAKINEALGQLNHAVYYADNRIEKAKETIKKLQKQLADCLKQCHKDADKKTKIGFGWDSLNDRKIAKSSAWEEEFSTLIEELERSSGRDLTEEEIKAYWDDPEELYRSLSVDPSDNDGFEIELEDARNTSGVNAFDAGNVEQIGSGDYEFEMSSKPGNGQLEHDYSIETENSNIVNPSVTVNIGNDGHHIDLTPIEIDEDVEVKIGTETPAIPPPPLQVSHSGVISFDHFVGESPCPQKAGQVTFNTNTGNRIEVVSMTLDGSVKPKLNLKSQGNMVKADFNCSSPENGRFSGTAKVTVKDVVTGQTKVLSIPASGGVSGSL